MRNHRFFAVPAKGRGQRALASLTYIVDGHEAKKVRHEVCILSLRQTFDGAQRIERGVRP